MWYVVQVDDSLFLIAQKFGITPMQLMYANQLTDTSITTGQRLFIPVSVSKVAAYSVKPGDSLNSIARRHNTTAESIMTLNNLETSGLTVGQRLVIPQYTEFVVNADRADIRSGPGPNYSIRSSVTKTARFPDITTGTGWISVRLHDGRQGWISRSLGSIRVYDGSKPIMSIAGFCTLQEENALPGSFRSFVDNASQLSETPLFMFRFSGSNPAMIEKFGNFPDSDVNLLVSAAHRNNIMTIPVIHNLLYEEGGRTANRETVKKMVATPQSRAASISSIISLIKHYGFDGANIDIEDVYQEDSARVSAFYSELGAEMKKNGYFLSASVPARIRDYPPFNPFSDQFDYSAIGAAVDQFIVMLYNEHGWPGSPPGSVASGGWMARAVGYTITKVPASKVVAAISVFGFDFNLTSGNNTYVTYQTASDLAQKYNRDIIFDEASLTPMFSYQDEFGGRHEVWFENKDSIIAKIRLAWQMGIPGVALWRLGMEDPSVWPQIAADMVVKKF